jgi:hypothetical protein
MRRATIRAQVVLPTPRGPQNSKAWASLLLSMAFFNVVVICSWPTTSSKPVGRYFRADTTKLSIWRKIEFITELTMKICYNRVDAGAELF